MGQTRVPRQAKVALCEDGSTCVATAHVRHLCVSCSYGLCYAYLILTQDNFGYGESVLSMVFALNGLAVGALQLFGMRHLVRILGKHVMLIVGNVLLAVGMVGMALSRQPVVHFAVSWSFCALLP